MSSQLADNDREEAEYRQAIIDSLQTGTRRNSAHELDQPDTSNGTTNETIAGKWSHTRASKSIQTLTQNTDLRLGNHFDPVDDPLGDTLIYIGIPPPSKNQTSGENNYMKKHFDNFFVLQSSAIRALQSSTFDRLLGPNACIRAEKRFKKLSAYKDLFASVKSRIKYHIDLRPPNEDDEAVLLITDLTCSYGILNWHRAEPFYSLPTSAIGGTDCFDGPSNPYYVELKDAKHEVTELKNRPPVAEYCPIRHHSGLERLINAIAGNDPKLDSAPKMWVFFALARYFGCSQNDSIRKWIFAWLWQPNNHNFVQSNPEAAYRIGLGCHSQELARDSFAILAGEKALVDVSRQLRGTVSPSLSSVHGRPFEILDDDELNRVGHAATSLLRRMRSILQDLICKADWMKESSEFRRLLDLETSGPAQRQILSSSQEAVLDFVKQRLTTILVCDLRNAQDIFHGRAESASTHKRYTLDLVDTYNQLPYLARPFTRSFWQAMYNIKLDGNGTEDDSLVWQAVYRVEDKLGAQDAILGLGLTIADFQDLRDLERKISMVNDTITARETPPQFAFRPKTQESISPMVRFAPEPPRKRYTMKRVSDEWVIEDEANTVVPADTVPPNPDPTSPLRSKQLEDFAPPSPGKRRKISGNQFTLDPFQSAAKTVLLDNSNGSQHTEGISTNALSRAGQSSSSSNFSKILSSIWNGSSQPTTSMQSSQPAAPVFTNDIGPVPSDTQPTSNTGTAGQHNPAISAEARNTIQPWAAQVLPIRQQPSSVPPVWQTSAGDQPDVSGRAPETTLAIAQQPRAKAHAAMEFGGTQDADLNDANEDPAGSFGLRAPTDSWWSAPTKSSRDRRPLQQFSNTNTESSVRFDRPEAGTSAPLKVKHVNLQRMLGEFEQVVHRRAMDIVYPAHIFHDSSSLPVNMLDHVFCLNEDEWKYLPLTVGGLDDGSGGVFDDAIPNIEVGGFRGGKRGIGSVGKSNGNSESGASSFDDIASEAVSTVGNASKIATDGTETVKSYNESESDIGFDYTDLYNEVQQMKVEQDGHGHGVTNAGDGAAQRDDGEDDSTIMGATSDIQGDFFGADDWGDDNGELTVSDEDSDTDFVDVTI